VVLGALIRATSNLVATPRTLAHRVVATHSGFVVLDQTVSSKGKVPTK
jgi:hypothetical protein